MAPPVSAEFPASTQFSTMTRFDPFPIAPPWPFPGSHLARLSTNLEPVIVTFPFNPPVAIAPPQISAVFSKNVQFSTLNGELLECPMAPPPTVAAFPTNVQSIMVAATTLGSFGSVVKY